MINNNQIGMICEQGDMGLHFDPLSEREQRILKEQEEKEKEDTKRSSRNK